ncbi:hypothetical protein ACJX0J_017215, partial [Zea mays]
TLDRIRVFIGDYADYVEYVISNLILQFDTLPLNFEFDGYILYVCCIFFVLAEINNTLAVIHEKQGFILSLVRVCSIFPRSTIDSDVMGMGLGTEQDDLFLLVISELQRAPETSLETSGNF